MLKDITMSETSDQAVKKFEKVIERLQDLDIALGYVDLLKEVDKLRLVIDRSFLRNVIDRY